MTDKVLNTLQNSNGMTIHQNSNDFFAMKKSFISIWWCWNSPWALPKKYRLGKYQKKHMSCKFTSCNKERSRTYLRRFNLRGVTIEVVWQNTSYELRVASYKLRVTSSKFKSTSSNSKVRVQIRELRVQIHELKNHLINENLSKQS